MPRKCFAIRPCQTIPCIVVRCSKFNHTRPKTCLRREISFVVLPEEWTPQAFLEIDGSNFVLEGQAIFLGGTHSFRGKTGLVLPPSRDSNAMNRDATT